MEPDLGVQDLDVEVDMNMAMEMQCFFVEVGLFRVLLVLYMLQYTAIYRVSSWRPHYYQSVFIQSYFEI